VTRRPILDGFDDPDVLDCHRFYFRRIPVEDHRIGELAGFERTIAALLPVSVGCIDRDRLQRRRTLDSIEKTR